MPFINLTQPFDFKCMCWWLWCQVLLALLILCQVIWCETDEVPDQRQGYHWADTWSQYTNVNLFKLIVFL